MLSLLFAHGAISEDLTVADQRYVVDIELQTAEEFGQLLDRAEQLLLDGSIMPQDEPKVTFVLHGPVLRDLMRENYSASKGLVDKAASLSAMDVIEVKACRTWMTSQGLDPQDLQPFIETVSYGPGEVRQLVQEQNYHYF